MIQFDKDGVTLVGYDANGNRFAHNYLEGSLYDDMLTVRKAQIAAAGENANTAASYKNLLDQYAINFGRPGCPALPVKPSQKVIDDLGNVSFVPFVPALPDFVPPHVDPPKPIKTDAADRDKRDDVMYNMIVAIFQKLYPDA
jgi:hypothetical protein